MKTSRREALGGALKIVGAGVSVLSLPALGKGKTLRSLEAIAESASHRAEGGVEVAARGVEEGAGPKLVARWKLDGDCRDSVGAHHGEGHSIKFVEGSDGRPGGAAQFNGVDAFAEVAHDEDLPFGTREFSLAFWVKLPENLPAELARDFHGLVSEEKGIGTDKGTGFKSPGNGRKEQNGGEKDGKQTPPDSPFRLQGKREE